MERPFRSARPHRVLVVDDETVVCAAIAAFLTEFGFSVECAHSLAEARKKLSAARFCAAVLDVRLPDGDGLSLVGTPAAGSPVVISATPEEDRYRRLGVAHHLAKPLDLRDLAQVLVRVTATRAGDAFVEPCRC